MITVYNAKDYPESMDLQLSQLPTVGEIVKVQTSDGEVEYLKVIAVDAESNEVMVSTF